MIRRTATHAANNALVSDFALRRLLVAASLQLLMLVCFSQAAAAIEDSTNDYGPMEFHSDGWWESLEDQANIGNVYAQIYLGPAYIHSEYFATNYEKSIYWFSMAAEKKHAFAMNALSNILLNGPKNLRNKDLGMRYLKESALLGNVLAQYDMGMRFLFAEGYEQNDAIAANWFSLAARHSLESLYSELMSYRPGSFPLTPDAEKSSALEASRISKMIRVKFLLSHVFVTLALNNKDNVRDIILGHLNEVIELGSQPAVMFSNLVCDPQASSFQNNRDYFLGQLRHLTDNKFPAALFAIGISHAYGYYGVQKDEAKGMRLIKRAAELGFDLAENELSCIYADNGLAHRHSMPLVCHLATVFLESRMMHWLNFGWPRQHRTVTN